MNKLYMFCVLVLISACGTPASEWHGEWVSVSPEEYPEWYSPPKETEKSLATMTQAELFEHYKETTKEPDQYKLIISSANSDKNPSTKKIDVYRNDKRMEDFCIMTMRDETENMGDIKYNCNDISSIMFKGDFIVVMMKKSEFILMRS